jgi:hypothetical protein
MNFKEYLIKYTQLHIDFITDFYTTITGEYINRQMEYLININILKKWIHIEDNLYDQIIKNLKINDDYKLINYQIMLSREGAKLLCELSFDQNKYQIIKNLDILEETFIEFINDPDTNAYIYFEE